MTIKLIAKTTECFPYSMFQCSKVTSAHRSSVAKFIFSYGVGCMKKVTSQECKMQKNIRCWSLIAIWGDLRWWKSYSWRRGYLKSFWFCTRGSCEYSKGKECNISVCCFCLDTIKRYRQGPTIGPGSLTMTVGIWQMLLGQWFEGDNAI